MSVTNSAQMLGQSDLASPANTLRLAYRTDPEWRDVLEKGDKAFSQVDDLVYHEGRLFVPTTLRLQVLQQHHDSPSAGHQGRARTLDLVARN